SERSERGRGIFEGLDPDRLFLSDRRTARLRLKERELTTAFVLSFTVLCAQRTLEGFDEGEREQCVVVEKRRHKAAVRRARRQDSGASGGAARTAGARRATKTPQKTIAAARARRTVGLSKPRKIDRPAPMTGCR